jgi:hypothetical protein
LKESIRNLIEGFAQIPEKLGRSRFSPKWGVDAGLLCGSEKFLKLFGLSGFLKEHPGRISIHIQQWSHDPNVEPPLILGLLPALDEPQKLVLTHEDILVQFIDPPGLRVMGDGEILGQGELVCPGVQQGPSVLFRYCTKLGSIGSGNDETNIHGRWHGFGNSRQRVGPQLFFIPGKDQQKIRRGSPPVDKGVLPGKITNLSQQSLGRRIPMQKEEMGYKP